MKILLKSVEQNVNYLNTGETASGYMLRPIRYSTIGANDLVDTIAKNSYVPRTYVAATLEGIMTAMENYLLNGHSIELPNFGFFTLSCDCKVAKTAAEAGMDQFKKLNIKFRPSTALKNKLNDVDVEMDGVWRCLDLEAENKVYERITPSTNLDAELPDDDGDENVNPGGNNNNNPGDDFVG